MLRVIEALFVCLKQQLKFGPNLSDMYNLCSLTLETGNLFEPAPRKNYEEHVSM